MTSSNFIEFIEMNLLKFEFLKMFSTLIKCVPWVSKQVMTIVKKP